MVAPTSCYFRRFETPVRVIGRECVADGDNERSESPKTGLKSVRKSGIKDFAGSSECDADRIWGGRKASSISCNMIDLSFEKDDLFT